MNRSILLALSSSFLLAGAGCASSVDDPAVVVATDAEALTAAQPVFPPRVESPIGASQSEVCGRDDGDMKKAFFDYLASIGQKPNQTHMEYSGPTPRLVCKYCYLDGSMQVNNLAVAFEDSVLLGPRFMFPIVDARLKNVYARGLHLPQNASLDLENVDMRCATGPSHAIVKSAKNVDLSGTTRTMWSFGGSASDVRMTGADADVYFEGGAASDLRFDGSTARVWFTDEHVEGTTRFDKAGWITLSAGRTTFAGGSVVTNGAHGTFAIGDEVVFDGTDLSESDGGLSMSGAENARTPKAKWPVGKGGFVPDASLPKLDLSGAQLVTKDKAWPASDLNLDGLRLSHGAFPDGADLTRMSLSGAHLEQVDLRNAKLSRTDGQGTVGANLSNVHAARVKLAGANIDGVDFTLADLRGADLTGVTGTATFKKAFAGALAPHVDGNEERIATSFLQAHLQRSVFTEAQLQYAEMKQADLADVTFEGAELDWARFDDAHFARLTTGGRLVGNMTLGKAKSLHALRLDRADLRGVSLADADLGPLVDPHLTRAEATLGAAPARTSLVGALLCGADLTGAKLHGADLTGVLFDVDGYVQFPEGGTGPCAAGKRDRVETMSTGGAVTACPLYGHEPAGPGGMCSDAQWRVSGITPPHVCPTDKHYRNGGPCTDKCECQSNYCDMGKHTCQPDPG